MSLTTSRKLASTPRVSRSAVSVSLLPSTLARTPGLPVFSTETTLGVRVGDAGLEVGRQVRSRDCPASMVLTRIGSMLGGGALAQPEADLRGVAPAGRDGRARPRRRVAASAAVTAGPELPLPRRSGRRARGSRWRRSPGPPRRRVERPHVAEGGDVELVDLPGGDREMVVGHSSTGVSSPDLDRDRQQGGVAVLGSCGSSLPASLVAVVTSSSRAPGPR